MTEKYEICERCDGRGYYLDKMDYSDPYEENFQVNCPECSGKGKLPFLTPEEHADAHADRLEWAMEEGMLQGVGAYNEIMSYD